TATVTQPADASVQVVTSVAVGGPMLTFGLDRIEELQRTVIRIPLWQYIASAIYVLLAFLAAIVVNYLVTVQLKRAFVRAKWSFGEAVVSMLHGPVRMLVLVMLLQMGLKVFRWPGWIEVWLGKG